MKRDKKETNVIPRAVRNIKSTRIRVTEIQKQIQATNIKVMIILKKGISTKNSLEIETKEKTKGNRIIKTNTAIIAVTLRIKNTDTVETIQVITTKTIIKIKTIIETKTFIKTETIIKAKKEVSKEEIRILKKVTTL